MTGNDLNILLRIGAKHALYRADGRWYHNLKAFPGALFDEAGWILFESEEAYRSHTGVQIRNDLHVPGGISSLPGYEPFPAELKTELAHNDVFADSEVLLRVLRTIEVIPRDVELVRRLKTLYRDSCQICGTQLQVRENNYYSEVHHIRPLGRPHNGPDTLDNMICLCPNHHALLDLFSMPLRMEELHVIRHNLNSEYLGYHNNICLRLTQRVP